MDNRPHLQNIIDSLSAHVAVLDGHGVIIAVNAAWKNFADDNDSRLPEYGVGINYIELCAPGILDTHGMHGAASPNPVASDFSRQAALGIIAVLMHSSARFQLTYPCHSPTEQRWFLLTVTPLIVDDHRFAIVAHENVTTLKQREESITAALIGTVEAIS